VDATLVAKVKAAKVRCECGAEVPVLEADEHECAATARARTARTASAAAQLAKAPAVVNRSTFTCPLCRMANLTAKALVEHCNKEHSRCRRVPAICPICAAMPWGDPSYVSADFLNHLNLRHKCDYETLTDFAEDEETILARVLQQSAMEAAASAGQSGGGGDDAGALARALLESAQDVDDGESEAEESEGMEDEFEESSDGDNGVDALDAVEGDGGQAEQQQQQQQQQQQNQEAEVAPEGAAADQEEDAAEAWGSTPKRRRT